MELNSLPGEVAAWLGDPSHWTGTAGVPHRLFEHAWMSLAAVALAAAVALPLGVGLGRRARGAAIALNLSNVGRAVPSLAILALAQQAIGLGGWPGFGARPALIALVALAVPPLVTNAYVGVRSVPAEVREAATGMGMTAGQVLARVDLPLAAPVVMAGIRTAAVQVVATATLAAITAWGGLGRFIVDGFGQQDRAQIVVGALLVAGLAVLTEAVLAVAQRLVVAAPLRTAPARGRARPATMVKTA